jgi:hypothetical protein
MFKNLFVVVKLFIVVFYKLHVIKFNNQKKAFELSINHIYTFNHKLKYIITYQTYKIYLPARKKTC